MRIPTNVGAEHKPTTLKRGQKKLGDLSPRPKVLRDTLIAGKYILVLRDPTQFPLTREQRTFYTDNNRDYMEVRYGEEFAVYQLLPERLVYSDGPPHPDHLQLALRVRKSAGVAEPGVSEVGSRLAEPNQAAPDDQEV